MLKNKTAEIMIELTLILKLIFILKVVFKLLAQGVFLICARYYFKGMLNYLFIEFTEY